MGTEPLSCLTVTYCETMWNYYLMFFFDLTTYLFQISVRKTHNKNQDDKNQDDNDVRKTCKSSVEMGFAQI